MGNPIPTLMTLTHIVVGVENSTLSFFVGGSQYLDVQRIARSKRFSGKSVQQRWKTLDQSAPVC